MAKTKGEKDSFRKDFFGADDGNRFDCTIVSDERVLDFVKAIEDGGFNLNQPERVIRDFGMGAATQDQCTKAVATWRSWNHSNKSGVYNRTGGGNTVGTTRIKEDDLVRVADDKTKSAIDKLNAQLAKLTDQKKELLDGLKEKVVETRKDEKQEKTAMNAIQKLLDAGLSLEKIKAMLG